MTLLLMLGTLAVKGERHHGIPRERGALGATRKAGAVLGGAGKGGGVRSERQKAVRHLAQMGDGFQDLPQSGVLCNINHSYVGEKITGAYVSIVPWFLVLYLFFFVRGLQPAIVVSLT